MVDSHFNMNHSSGLQKEMATHSSILAWEIPWTEEPCGQMQRSDANNEEGEDVSNIYWLAFVTNSLLSFALSHVIL